MHIDPILPVIVGIAFVLLLMALGLRLLKQPSVVAYLLAGILIGLHGIGPMDDQANIINAQAYQLAIATIALSLLLSPGWIMATKKIVGHERI